MRNWTITRNRKKTGFIALRVEGGIFPPEFLNVIAAQEATNQSNHDYGLTRSFVLREELARYWRIANDLYANYTKGREQADLITNEVGIDGWLVPLFKKIFGFDDLVSTPPLVIDGHSFPITHLALGGSMPILFTTIQFELDRADLRFGSEGRRRSPHALMQDFLNASNDVRWGIISNGAKIRVLRNNPSLTRPAYVEADLNLIFSEQLYPDFATLWLIIHASRFRSADGKAASTIIERWRVEAHQTGERALEHLREGVKNGLLQLGNGFLQHPGNDYLQIALQEGQVAVQDYFQQLLRLVYRLLFLFTAEERNLLHISQATDDQRAIYEQGYSLAKLRDFAGKRRHYDHHDDLWQGLKILFGCLARGEQTLGLPALGGLFEENQCKILETGQISNKFLLEAIRSLGFFQTNGRLARVNYRDIGMEELGSVYESLLELHPQIDVNTRPWKFDFIERSNGEKKSTSERKLTGSYYTPAVLVNELIKSALEPVMADVIANSSGNPRKALLDLKILDPACGSGHFLLAAARRMATEIARLESGTDTPDEITRQHALREVVQHSIYGVDRNPLAVELCRTALWIETIEPSKPLTFLDHHIQCGDSLVGVLDPSILEKGIPNDAYKELIGDCKVICCSLRNKNRENRAMEGFVQGNLFDPDSLKSIAAVTADFDKMPEETLEDIASKRSAWEKVEENTTQKRIKLQADLFVAAFFAPKIKETLDRVPVTEDLYRVVLGIESRREVENFARELARKHRFFHWHVAFPEVMEKGGFDVVLGNPPWERIKLQEQEFFANRNPEIANAPNAAARNKLIEELKRSDVQAEKNMFFEFEQAKRHADASSQFIRTSGRYPLTGRGDINTYSVFAETVLQLVGPYGRAGIIVPTGIATDDTNKLFFEYLIEHGELVSMFDFENRQGIFPEIHRSYKFSLLTLHRKERVTTCSMDSQTRNAMEKIDHSLGAEFAFFCHEVSDLADTNRRFTLALEDFKLLNPNTRTAPIFRSRTDAELTKAIYRRVPVLIREDSGVVGNPWGIKFQAMFHMANDSHLFRTRADLEEQGYHLEGNIFVRDQEHFLPLYEAKMIHQFNHRFGDYLDQPRGSKSTQLPEILPERLANPHYRILPRYWIAEQEVDKRLADRWNRRWLLGWRDIARSTDERTVIASVIPRVAVSGKYPLIFPISPENIVLLVAALNSLSFDYCTRQKLGGTSLACFIMKQLPIFSPQSFDKPCPWSSTENIADFIRSRVLELTYTAYDLEPFARDLGYEGPPFLYDPERRFRLRCELDALFFHLYLPADSDGGWRRAIQEWAVVAESPGELGILKEFFPKPRDAVDYILDQFPIIRSNDEKRFGDYRTKQEILKIYDAMQERTFLGLEKSEGSSFKGIMQ